MAGWNRLAEALDGLFDECAITPADRRLGLATNIAAVSTAKRTPITAKLLAGGELPEKLERFLTWCVAHPENSADANLAWSSAMQSFGLRIARVLLHIGLNRRRCDTDVEQNKADASYIADLLTELAVECSNTPFIPRDTVELLGRGANAVRDVRFNNTKPALLAHLAPEECKLPRKTAGIECKGRLAAALEIVIRGRMKPAAAKRWLEAEMNAAGLVDEAGNAIRGARVASWRSR